MTWIEKGLYRQLTYSHHDPAPMNLEPHEYFGPPKRIAVKIVAMEVRLPSKQVYLYSALRYLSLLFCLLVSFSVY